MTEQSYHMGKYELRRFIKRLSGYRGRNTELISLYVPKDYNMNKIVDFLTSEKSEAQNIKSKQTRKNVQSALSKIQRRLKEVQQTPDNGVALFCGNISEQEGRPDIEMWEVVPPEPVKSRIYRCDKEFVLQPLKDMVIENNIFGLIVLDRKNAAIGSLKGKSMKKLYELESNVPGKHRKGGQSAARYERVIKQRYKKFLNDIAEKAKRSFLEKAREGELKGIIVGGPGFAKEDLVEEGYLSNELKDKVIAIKGTNYSGEEGLQELLDRSQEAIEKEEVAKEKKLVNEFLKNLKKDNKLSSYGLEEVARALKLGAVDKILLSEDVNVFEVKHKCTNCGEEKVEYKEEDEVEEEIDCPECNSEMVIEEKRDIVEVFAEKADQMDSELHLISTDTPEGKRLKELGGIAAVLRYRIS